MLTLPLEFAEGVLSAVMAENGKAWQGTDAHNKWTIARGVDDDTGMPLLLIIQEPIVYISKD